ncbi:MAG: hypothetical protein RMK57_17235, partial [Bryobacterales bacterium]|nr:hypothetical protein [Bryobacterales bacterium]
MERGDIARLVVAIGKIQPRAQVEIKSKASGIVQKILVDDGDWVLRLRPCGAREPPAPTPRPLRRPRAWLPP